MSPELLAQQFDIPEFVSTPPVDLWDPDFSGVMDLRIKANGTWIHEGGEIKRRELVRLFSSILKKEGQDYYLVTPVEKWQVSVEDTPLHITSAERINGKIHCTLLTGGVIELGREHKLIDIEPGAQSPSVEIRPGLFARFLRNAFYQLAELGEWGSDQLLVSSGQHTFQLAIPAQ